MGAFSKTLVLLLLAETSFSQTYCRNGKVGGIPHHQSMWHDDFPSDTSPYALCEGNINVDVDGTICIEGRVNYEQLEEAVGKPVRAPAAKSISVSGHLIGGSGNVVLGTEAKFLYDFVTRYTINGVTYEADDTIADKMLAASRGTIDSVCFDASFAQDVARYKISHDFWFPKNLDVAAATEANLLYFSAWSAVAEYYEPSNRSPFFGHITNSLITFASGLAPTFVFRYLPLLGFTGFFRLFVIGTMDTEKFPQPITAPNVDVENYQVDTKWSTLMAAIDDGLFTEDKVPLYFGVLIKKIEPGPKGIGCWNTTSASIDIQAPSGRGDKLDEYLTETVLPALSVHGSYGLHMGKRLENGSDSLKTALETYNRQCNVELNLSPDVCYHPACRRSETLSTFTYPEQYYEERK